MASFTPTDGRMTSFQTLPAPLGGGELMWIVSPGNAALGNLYNVTTATIAAFAGAFPYLNTEEITAGATIVSPYQVETTDTAILFKKTIGSASYAVLPLASSMVYPYGILFKDLKGDANTNNITVTFTGGQLCDGMSTLEIDIAYGWFKIFPAPGGAAWYMGS